jgi:hypothetical protein
MVASMALVVFIFFSSLDRGPPVRRALDASCAPNVEK